MESAATIFYWARFGLVVLVTILAIVSAIRRSQAKAARRDLVAGAIGVILAGLANVIASPAANYVLSVILLVVGVAVGFALAKARPVIAWSSAVCVVFAAIMILFGEPQAFGIGLAVLTLAAALPFGQGLRGLMPGSAGESVATA